MTRILNVAVTIALLGASACSTTTAGQTITSVLRQPVNELERDPVPGTVNDVWVEPMYNTVRVPGKLDPRGNYYRPAHNTVVEIRHERFQVVEYPEDRVVPEGTFVGGENK